MAEVNFSNTQMPDEQDKVDRVRGMDITIVTSAKNDQEGRALLKALGFPFRD